MSPRELEPGSQQRAAGEPGLRGSGQSRQWGRGLSTYLRLRTLGGLARLRDTPERGQSARAPPPAPLGPALTPPSLQGSHPRVAMAHARTRSQPFGHPRRSTPARSDKTHSQETQGAGRSALPPPPPFCLMPALLYLGVLGGLGGLREADRQL